MNDYATLSEQTGLIISMIQRAHQMLVTFLQIDWPDLPHERKVRVWNGIMSMADQSPEDSERICKMQTIEHLEDLQLSPEALKAVIHAFGHPESSYFFTHQLEKVTGEKSANPDPQKMLDAVEMVNQQWEEVFEQQQAEEQRIEEQIEQQIEIELAKRISTTVAVKAIDEAAVLTELQKNLHKLNWLNN